ncbi:hypothetical protein [Arthrobacter sp. HLT1-20]
MDAVFGGHLFDEHSSLVVGDELCGLLALDLIDLDLYFATAMRIIDRVAVDDPHRLAEHGA